MNDRMISRRGRRTNGAREVVVKRELNFFVDRIDTRGVGAFAMIRFVPLTAFLRTHLNAVRGEVAWICLGAPGAAN